MNVMFRDLGHAIVIEPSHAIYEGRECDEMESRLIALVQSGARVVVDLTHVDHMTAHCIGVLAHAHGIAKESGGRIVLCGTNRIERGLLVQMGLTDALPVFDDVTAAVRSLTREAVSAA